MVKSKYLSECLDLDSLYLIKPLREGSLLEYLIVVSYHTIHKDNKKALLRKKDGKETSNDLLSRGKRKKSFRFFYTILGDMGLCYSSCIVVAFPGFKF